MYADDIILLSTSAKGLQRKLDKLNDYCKDWCLNTNTSKTKIMVFNKAGRHLKLDFKFNDVKLECASNYRYLGLKFNSSGSFSFAQKQLYQKALKAFFKLKKDFISLSPNVKSTINVFEHTIKPMFLYGSEIWGYFNPFSKKNCQKGIYIRYNFQ
jgi:hypothetical protein